MFCPLELVYEKTVLINRLLMPLNACKAHRSQPQVRNNRIECKSLRDSSHCSQAFTGYVNTCRICGMLDMAHPCRTESRAEGLSCVKG